jgi:nitric oxide reductase NorQ protein
VTMIKSNLSNFTKIVRDHLYETTAPGQTKAKRGITVDNMLADVNALRGVNTSSGAVRRSLRDIRDAGLGKMDDTVRPAVYRWNPNETKPSDYQQRKVQTQQKGNSVATPAAPQTDDDKRDVLRGKLKNRMAEITGEKVQAEEEEKIPEPKKDAKPGVKRLNGQTYLPRDIAGRSDIDTLKILRDKNIFALLSGPPGTGKTVLVDATFGEELHTVTADENTNVDDFLGQWSPDGHGSYVWVDGPLVLAMRSGGVLFIDDATLANPKVLAVCYPAMDGRGEITVKSHIVNGHPDVVQAQPGFYVVAAHNPGVHGAILTDALASRFIFQLWVETDLELAASLGVGAKFLKLVKALRVDRDKGQSGLWIPQLRELLAARNLSHAFNEEVAAQNMLGVAPEDDRDWIAAKMKVIFGKELKPLELGGQL